LLVVRNAENVNPNSANAHDFSNYLDRLISYSGDRIETKMVAFDGLQGSSVVGPLEQCSMQSQTLYVPLSALSANATNTAGLCLFLNPVVAHHPGNKGMRLIIQVIWQSIQFS